MVFWKKICFFLCFRCLELEVLSATYKPDAVQALRRLRSRLDAAHSAVRSESDRLTSTLRQYESAGGEDLAAVAEELAALKEQIRGKEWALAELRQTS